MPIARCGLGRYIHLHGARHLGKHLAAIIIIGLNSMRQYSPENYHGPCLDTAIQTPKEGPIIGPNKRRPELTTWLCPLDKVRIASIMDHGVEVLGIKDVVSSLQP